MLPRAVLGTFAVIIVNVGHVESEARTCYFGAPPEPRPGEHWMKAAVREIHKRCPYTEAPSEHGHVDCQALRDAGIYTTEGVNNIYPPQYPGGLQVYCYIGWIMFQKRFDGSVEFNRNWAEYRDGFGDLTGEFWLGNEKLRRLTEEGEWVLGISLTNRNGPVTLGMYDSFRVEGHDYTLRIGNIQAGNLFVDSLSESHANQSFSTYDRDNDANASANCAELLRAGWWFNECPPPASTEVARSNLNGEYSYRVSSSSQNYRGMRWDGYAGQILTSGMGLRRGP